MEGTEFGRDIWKMLGMGRTCERDGGHLGGTHGWDRAWKDMWKGLGLGRTWGRERDT